MPYTAAEFIQEIQVAIRLSHVAKHGLSVRILEAAVEYVRQAAETQEKVEKFQRDTRTTDDPFLWLDAEYVARRAAAAESSLSTLQGQVKALERKVLHLEFGNLSYEDRVHQLRKPEIREALGMQPLGSPETPRTTQDKSAPANLGLLFHAAEHFRDEEANATDPIDAGHFASLWQAVEWAREQLHGKVAETPRKDEAGKP